MREYTPENDLTSRRKKWFCVLNCVFAPGEKFMLIVLVARGALFDGRRNWASSTAKQSKKSFFENLFFRLSAPTRTPSRKKSSVSWLIQSQKYTHAHVPITPGITVSYSNVDSGLAAVTAAACRRKSA